LKISLADFKNTAAAAEPEPAFIVGEDLGNIFIVQSVFGADQSEVTIFKAAHAKAGVADPEGAVGCGIKTTNRKGRAAHQRGFVFEMIALDTQQNTFGRPEPDPAGGILGDGADAADIRRGGQGLEVSFAVTFDAVWGRLAEEEVPCPAGQYGQNSLAFGALEAWRRKKTIRAPTKQAVELGPD